MIRYTGHIELILGPMFSGKSTELLRKVQRYQIAKKKVITVNYHFDNRYSEQDVVSTHDKYISNHRITKKAIKCSKLNQIKQQLYKYEVIAIDQGQFFTDITQIAELFANQGKVILVAALDGTFQRQPFGKILDLVPKAEKVIKLSAVCYFCSKDAYYSKRFSPSKQVQLIGGAQLYKPVCRSCYFTEQQSKQLSVQTIQSPQKQKQIQVI